MMRENWRLNRVQRIKDDEQEEENPRKKRRRGQYGGRVDWGVTELSEDKVQRGKWLVEDEGRIDQKGMLKQSTLKPWSKIKLMTRELILDLADEIVEGREAPIAPTEGGEEQEEHVNSKDEPGV